ncbi:hypothetical protein A2379_01735 [Candidatus Amesbacteria bacterium RIFOXYB1_FULL_47_13]|nr:MAG: hypothetical protein A2379_01735 [Candidatus Amesbacteria bacterium RIFOXYB1_FULL_47_13]HBC72678.1 hypothetical protein [Candidatus Amesbacteria bacterium]
MAYLIFEVWVRVRGKRAAYREKRRMEPIPSATLWKMTALFFAGFLVDFQISCQQIAGSRASKSMRESLTSAFWSKNSESESRME